MTDEILTQLSKPASGGQMILLPRQDPFRAVACTIKRLAAEGTDPLILAGVLLEGTVHLLATVPLRQRNEAVTTATQLFANRLAAHDLI